jgi:hypothetical protein
MIAIQLLTLALTLMRLTRRGHCNFDTVVVDVLFYKLKTKEITMQVRLLCITFVHMKQGINYIIGLIVDCDKAEGLWESAYRHEDNPNKVDQTL